MTRRKRTPTTTETELLARCRRRCCICYGLEGDLTEKDGQIAHLDKDPSNSALDNLAYLCLRHHNQYDSRRSQSKGLTIGEVKRFREELYQALAAGEVAREGTAGETEVRDVVQIGNPIIRLLRRVRLSRVLQVGGGRIEVTGGGRTCEASEEENPGL